MSIQGSSSRPYRATYDISTPSSRLPNIPARSLVASIEPRHSPASSSASSSPYSSQGSPGIYSAYGSSVRVGGTLSSWGDTAGVETRQVADQYVLPSALQPSTLARNANLSNSSGGRRTRDMDGDPDDPKMRLRRRLGQPPMQSPSIVTGTRTPPETGDRSLSRSESGHDDPMDVSPQNLSTARTQQGHDSPGPRGTISRSESNPFLLPQALNRALPSTHPHESIVHSIREDATLRSNFLETDDLYRMFVLGRI